MAQKPHDPSFTIDAVVSSKSGRQLKPSGETLTVERLHESGKPFSFSEYNRKAHMPEALPQINLDGLQTSYLRCLDMPLRLAGQTEYFLPEEWEGLSSIIENIISQEHAVNKNWRDYHTYMTVDSKHVIADEQQRHGGLHVDGFQGERISPKTKITRNYVMTTNGGTRFYRQPFVVVDEKSLNVFQGFDLQAGDYEIAEENTVYFMDAYCVHESGVAQRDGLRTFLRVTYDLKKFDREHNTHNSLLNYNWDMVVRNVHETVKTPTLQDVLSSPHR